jgi:cadmium resistance protein CadD (predicted permease)
VTIVDQPQVFMTALVLVPIAYAATNIDNLLIMATLASTTRRGQLIAGFLAASIGVLFVASLATFIERVVPAQVIGYLGFVPLSIGVYLLVFTSPQAEEPASRSTGWTAVAGVLFANSGDTIFAVGPLFAESGHDARLGLAFGFTLIASIWLVLILNVSQRVARSALLQNLGPRVAPWMMILVGLYILSDSATDLV